MAEVTNVKNPNIWGSFGDIVFSFHSSPVYGSYKAENKYNFARHDRILNPALLQIVPRELKIITFEMKLTSIVYLRTDNSIGVRAIRATGISSVTGAASLGKTSKDETISNDIDLYVSLLEEYGTAGEPQFFYIGGKNQGEYVLTSFTEQSKHTRDGKRLYTNINIELLEYIG